MWPSHVDALEQTVAVEAQIEDLYAAALHKWIPFATAAVLPTLTAITADAYTNDDLPPDPDAVASTQAEWDALVVGSILPGVAAIWATAAAEAAAVDAVGGGLEGVLSALTDTRDDFLDVYAATAKAVPGRIRDNLRSLITTAPQQMSTMDLRSMVRDAVTPGSELLRKTSRRLGYTGASILNHAVMAVAKHAGAADRKTWRAILDERTRDTHWVADGQTVPIDGEFTVGGVPMAFPGDPRAPARETVNCRCRIAVLTIGEAPRLRRGPAAEARRRAERGVTKDVDELPLVAAVEEGTDMTAPVEIVEEQTQEGELFRTFTDCPIAFIGTPTSDRRLLAKDIELSYRSMPVPLMWKRQNTEGHLDAFTVGVIESMRNDEGAIYASGYLLNTAEADEAATQLQHRVTRPSIDIGEHEWAKTDADGNVFDDETWWHLGELEPKVFNTFTSAEIIAMTLVATPAFGDTMLSLNEARESRDPGLLASSDFTPRLYPAGHFADPKLAEPTRPMLLDDGRVVGHIACWNKPHRDIRDELVYAPRSPSNYSHFHTGAVRVHDGRHISVGRLTVNCRHADKWLPPIPAAAHYDNTECCWALVRAGEDAHGIWFSGVTAPWATPERIEAGLASGLSGDWRNFGLGLDLVAALSVNTPALIVAGHNDAYGQPVSLVAALGPGPSARGGNHTLSHDDIKAAVTEALAEARFIAERDEALAAAASITRPKTPDEEIDELLAKVRG